jgi:hypothetical protein
MPAVQEAFSHFNTPLSYVTGISFFFWFYREDILKDTPPFVSVYTDGRFIMPFPP